LTQNFGGGKEIDDYHALPILVEDGSFVVVREPTTWIRSIWAYRLRDGWKKNRWVNNWPLIVSMTKWIEKKPWGEFVDLLYDHDFDIPRNVYGFYDHPRVNVFKLERLDQLQEHFGIDVPVPHNNKGKQLPTVSDEQREKLMHVCRTSRAVYGYE